MNVAKAIEGIPIVQSTAERNILFATPATDQRVFNKGTSNVERYDGISWVVDPIGGGVLFGYVNAGAAPYFAKPDGSDASAAINAALATGLHVYLPPGSYLAHGLTQSTNAQILFSVGGIAKIIKNANGTILASTGDNVQCINISFRGESAAPAFTGDNVTFSGFDCALINCGSRYAFGRAVKATGSAFHIFGTCDIYQTADATASGYDIEIGVSGTLTAYHELHGVYSSQPTGGILLVDTGSHTILGGQFGKLYVKSGTSPAGVNGGKTIGARILGNVITEQSSTIFTANQFGSVTVTFALGTSGCSLDASNITGSITSLVNNGNANNLIERNVSTGAAGNIQLKYGDDASLATMDITPNSGVFLFPVVAVQNNQVLKWLSSTGAQGAHAFMSNTDVFSILNDIANKQFDIYVTGTASTSQIRHIVGGNVRTSTDNNGFNVLGPNGSNWLFGYASELLVLSTVGATTDTVANLLPANAIIEAVVARVTTTITTATDWKLGDATTAGRFSAANAVMAAGTTQVGTVHADQTGAAGPRQAAAAKVRVTTTGTPGAGAIRITVFFRVFTPPTS